jgi:hypothetical protein
LPAGVRRRTTGLRGEKVASLAPISTEGLASLARALRLGLDERDHLFRLAGHPGAGGVAFGEALVQTPAGRALLGDQAAYRGFARNGVYRFFTDDDVRRMYPVEDHPAPALSFVADSRVACVRDGARSRAADYVERLLRCSPEFAELWKQHGVAQPQELTKRIVHPKLGVLKSLPVPASNAGPRWRRL